MVKVIDAIDMCEHKILNLQKEIYEIKNIIKRQPEFVIINASDCEANKRYIKGKIKEGERAGLKVTVLEYNNTVTNTDLILKIEELKQKKIPTIVQLPIYDHLDKDIILNHIDWSIDADGFTREWIGEINLGNDKLIAPATPKGVMSLLEFHNIDIQGKKVLIIGSSNHVSKPLIPMILNKGGTILNANINTLDLRELTRISDIIISCVGKANLINPEDIKDNAVLIGVGFTYINGKQVLDFDIDAMVENNRASIISNRLNCTGKATIISLIENVVELYKLNFK